ncbi:GNAT family N-acetyltransferase [Paenibacillus alba]|uniref:GNAT family N-acetyltransferase n=1 Tax=Paenibacillus alba TaxID=1197127 RepID=A0ABU6FXQ8_9BACL|nr:GNAT family N-acetyltransferase [Paenibacillus alba]MEC0226699.1 GNAT family N-acetyltransferase [Paenibacillus alba]
MKKVDAFWEMQNIGKTVLEIEFDNKDATNCLNELTSDFETYDYIVAKIPIGKLDIVHSLEDRGFRFMETQIELAYNLKKHTKASSYVKKLSDQAQCKKVNTLDQLNVLLSRIEEDLFITDRISLDPLLGKAISHKRYLNWLNDAFHKEAASIYEVELKSRDIGFFYSTTLDSTTIYGVLASVYKKYRNRGLGLIVLEAAFNWAKEVGYSKIITRVSSNNLEALRTNLNLGFESKNMYHILRKANFS